MSQRRIALQGATLVISFPYLPSLVEAVGAIPGRRWHSDRREWHVPVTYIRPVRAFGHSFGFDMSPEVLAIPDVEPVTRPDIAADAYWFAVSFVFDALLNEAVKELPGASWSPRRQAWLVPREAAIEVAVFAQQYEGVIQPSAVKPLMAANATLASLEASAALDADFDVPGFGLDLYPFQRAGVRYIVEHAQGRAILADERGLGKTRQALAAIHLMQTFPTVVVTPANARINWKRETAAAMPYADCFRLTGQGGYVPRGDGPAIYIVGWDTLGYWLPTLPKEIAGAVWDEVHRGKDPKAQRSQAALALAARVSPGGLRLGMSGTPVLNDSKEIVMALRLSGRLGDFGGRDGFRVNYAAKGRALALNRQLRSTCYVRRRKRDALPDLPPARWLPLPVEGSAPEMAEYRKAEADIVAYLAERAEQLALASGASGAEAQMAAAMAALRAESAKYLVAISNLRRLAAKAKIGPAKEWTRDFLTGGAKLIAFGWHTDVVDAMHTTFAANGAVKIQGGQTDTARQHAIDSFQTDEATKVIACQIIAAGEAITLTAASDCLFIEFGWNPGTMDQALGRADRIGQANSVTGWLMTAEGTIDEWLVELIEQKRQLVDAVTDGVEPLEDTSLVGDLVERLARKGLDRTPVLV